MSNTLKQLTHDALELSVQERTQLVHDLIASIDSGSDSDASSAWDDELKKRIREIKKGKIKGIPVKEVFVKLEEKYH